MSERGRKAQWVLHSPPTSSLSTIFDLRCTNIQTVRKMCRQDLSSSAVMVMARGRDSSPASPSPQSATPHDSDYDSDDPAAAQTKIANLRRVLAKRDTEFATLRADKAALQTRLHEAHDESTQLRNDVSQEKRMYESLMDRFRAQESRLVVTEREKHSLEISIDEFKHQNQRLAEDIKSMRTALELQHAREEDHEKLLEAATKRGNTLDLSVNRLIGELQAAESATRAAQRQIEDLKVESRNHHDQSEYVASRLTDVTAERDELLSEQGILRENLENKEEKLRLAKLRLAPLHEEKEDAILRAKKLNRKVQSLESDLELLRRSNPLAVARSPLQNKPKSAHYEHQKTPPPDTSTSTSTFSPSATASPPTLTPRRKLLLMASPVVLDALGLTPEDLEAFARTTPGGKALREMEKARETGDLAGREKLAVTGSRESAHPPRPPHQVPRRPPGDQPSAPLPPHRQAKDNTKGTDEKDLEKMVHNEEQELEHGEQEQEQEQAPVSAADPPPVDDVDVRVDLPGLRALLQAATANVTRQMTLVQEKQKHATTAVVDLFYHVLKLDPRTSMSPYDWLECAVDDRPNAARRLRSELEATFAAEWEPRVDEEKAHFRSIKKDYQSLLRTQEATLAERAGQMVEAHDEIVSLRRLLRRLRRVYEAKSERDFTSWVHRVEQALQGWRSALGVVDQARRVMNDTQAAHAEVRYRDHVRIKTLEEMLPSGPFGDEPEMSSELEIDEAWSHHGGGGGIGPRGDDKDDRDRLRPTIDVDSVPLPTTPRSPRPRSGFTSPRSPGRAHTSMSQLVGPRHPTSILEAKHALEGASRDAHAAWHDQMERLSRVVQKHGSRRRVQDDTVLSIFDEEIPGGSTKRRMGSPPPSQRIAPRDRPEDMNSKGGGTSTSGRNLGSTFDDAVDPVEQGSELDEQNRIHGFTELDPELGRFDDDESFGGLFAEHEDAFAESMGRGPGYGTHARPSNRTSPEPRLASGHGGSGGDGGRRGRAGDPRSPPRARPRSAAVLSPGGHLVTGARDMVGVVAPPRPASARLARQRRGYSSGYGVDGGAVAVGVGRGGSRMRHDLPPEYDDGDNDDPPSYHHVSVREGVPTSRSSTPVRLRRIDPAIPGAARLGVFPAHRTAADAGIKEYTSTGSKDLITTAATTIRASDRPGSAHLRGGTGNVKSNFEMRRTSAKGTRNETEKRPAWGAGGGQRPIGVVAVPTGQDGRGGDGSSAATMGGVETTEDVRVAVRASGRGFGRSSITGLPKNRAASARVAPM